MPYDNIKSHKKTGFSPTLYKIHFSKNHKKTRRLFLTLPLPHSPSPPHLPPSPSRCRVKRNKLDSKFPFQQINKFAVKRITNNLKFLDQICSKKLFKIKTKNVNISSEFCIEPILQLARLLCFAADIFSLGAAS